MCTHVELELCCTLLYYLAFTNVNHEVLSSLCLACCQFQAICLSQFLFCESSPHSKCLTFILSHQFSQLGIHHCIYISNHYMECVKKYFVGDPYFDHINMASTSDPLFQVQIQMHKRKETIERTNLLVQSPVNLSIENWNIHYSTM